MKKILYVLLCCSILAACADDKRYAPKEGRLSLSPELSLTAAQSQIKLADSQNPTQWKYVFQNPENNQPNLAVPQLNKPSWTTDIGKNYNQSNLPEAPVIVTKDAVYVLDGGFNLSRVDLKTGAQVWNKPLSTTPTNPVGLVATDKAIFAISDQGNLVAVDFNGEVVWKKDLNTTVRTSPTVDKNLIFVLSSRNVILALNQTNGNEVWRYQTTDSDTFLRGMAHPAVSKGVLIVPFTSGEVIAFDAASGMLQWAQVMIGNKVTDLYELPHILAAPVIDGNTVFLAGNANLLAAFDIHSGSNKWAENLGVIVTPVVSGNALFLITKDHHLMAMDTKTGNVFWNKEMPHDKKTTWTSLRLQNQQIVLANKNTEYIVNPTTGDVVSTQDKSDLIGTPIVIDNAVIGVNHRAKLKLYPQGDK